MASKKRQYPVNSVKNGWIDILQEPAPQSGNPQTAHVFDFLKRMAVHGLENTLKVRHGSGKRTDRVETGDKGVNSIQRKKPLCGTQAPDAAERSRHTDRTVCV